MGKAQGKDAHAEAARQHQSTPLSTLKDPASFAPPPKRLDYHGGASAASGARQRMQQREEERRQAEEEASRPPPGPYRPDTTGLSTAHLPKPPAFQQPGTASPQASAPATKPKPSLPPRLPPRQTLYPDEFAPAPPPTYTEATQQAAPAQGVLNPAALGRLGQAGVSVAGLGIGRTASPPVPPRANPSPPVPRRANPSPPVPPRLNSSASVDTQNAPSRHASPMNELQNRFAKMTGPKPAAEAPATGTSWADKQAALRTAGNLRNDPSKVSASDLKGAASTASNFQQRHGDQVASGWKSANSLNQKYGIAGKLNSFASSSSASPAPPSPGPPEAAGNQAGGGGLGKRAPPPPPPKKKGLSEGAGEPPPIPLSSKPKF